MNVYKYIGLPRVVLCLIPATHLPGHLEPDVLRPYQHVLQRGGHWAPTHHTVTSCLYFTDYTWSEGSFLPSSSPWRFQLQQQCSQDQAHGTAVAVQADWWWRGACFPSIINAMRLSADSAQDFKDQNTSSSRAVLTRRKASASLQGPAGFCFASSFDTTQVHSKPLRTSGLLLHKQSHRRSDALMWIEGKTDVFFYDSVPDVCGWFSSPCKYAIFAGWTEGLCCALHVCSLDFMFCITGAVVSTCLCMYVNVPWLFVIYIYSLSLSIQWFQFIYDISTVCLHFTCELGCAGGCGPVCAVAFYKCDVGNACFPVSVFASVELLGV